MKCTVWNAGDLIRIKVWYVVDLKRLNKVEKSNISLACSTKKWRWVIVNWVWYWNKDKWLWIEYVTIMMSDCQLSMILK